MSDNGATTSAGQVVVLGGNGFVGAKVVRSFAERGYQVRSASRSAHSTAQEQSADRVERVSCDVRERASVESALQGADIVVASFVGDARTQTDGIANVLAALSGRPQTRLLYLSTAEVYGNVGGRLDETAPLLRQGWAYADSKIEAEAQCRTAAARGTQVTLFRPSIVYGPNSETWIVELSNRLVAGHWGTFGRSGEGTCNLIYVDDLVEALHRSLTVTLEPGATFNLNGPDQLTWNEFFTLLNQELGLPPLRGWSRPEALMRASVGQLLRGLKALASRARGGNGPRTSLAVTAEGQRRSLPGRVLDALKATPRLQSLTQLYPRQVVYLDDKARKQIGYDPAVSARAGIARSAAWYRAARTAT